jgi:hypothetical protein
VNDSSKSAAFDLFVQLQCSFRLATEKCAEARNMCRDWSRAWISLRRERNSLLAEKARLRRAIKLMVSAGTSVGIRQKLQRVADAATGRKGIIE